MEQGFSCEFVGFIAFVAVFELSSMILGSRFAVYGFR